MILDLETEFDVPVPVEVTQLITSPCAFRRNPRRVHTDERARCKEGAEREACELEHSDTVLPVRLRKLMVSPRARCPCAPPAWIMGAAAGSSVGAAPSSTPVAAAVNAIWRALNMRSPQITSAVSA